MKALLKKTKKIYTKVISKIMYVYNNTNQSNRDKWIIEKLQNLEKGSSILDCGAGPMPYRQYCQHLKYKSQDYCQYKGKDSATGEDGLLNEKWNTSDIDIVSDIISIPVQNSSFDSILCSEVFEHIPYPIKAIEEFSRILKPDGKLILTAPFSCLAHQTPYFYYTGLSVFWYKKILEENNFKILEISANGNYFDQLLQEVQRIKFCVKEYCPNLDVKYPSKSIAEISRFLEECSSKQKHSEYLSCFGWHVLAQKNNMAKTTDASDHILP